MSHLERMLEPDALITAPGGSPVSNDEVDDSHMNSWLASVYVPVSRNVEEEEIIVVPQTPRSKIRFALLSFSHSFLFTLV